MSHAGRMRPIAVHSTSNTAIQIAYDASNNIEYVGLADIGTATSAAAWQIRKFTYDASNNLTSVQWPGNESFTFIWDNRASLSYS